MRRPAAAPGYQYVLLTQFAIFQTQLVRYEQERDAKEIEINALLNRPQGGHIEVADDPVPAEPPATLDDMLAHARTHAPMLAREQKMVERNDLASALARRGLLSRLHGLGRLFQSGRRCPRCGSSAWISSCPHTSARSRTRRSPRRPLRRPRRGTTTRPPASRSSRRSAETYTLAATARKLIDLYEKSVIPEAQLALESSMAGYQTGTLDFLSLFSNFMNVVDYELMYHEEMMQFQVAMARLEEMTGMPL